MVYSQSLPGQVPQQMGQQFAQQVPGQFIQPGVASQVPQQMGQQFAQQVPGQFIQPGVASQVPQQTPQYMGQQYAGQPYAGQPYVGQQVPGQPPQPVPGHYVSQQPVPGQLISQQVPGQLGINQNINQGQQPQNASFATQQPTQPPVTPPQHPSPSPQPSHPHQPGEQGQDPFGVNEFVKGVLKSAGEKINQELNGSKSQPSGQPHVPPVPTPTPQYGNHPMPPTPSPQPPVPTPGTQYGSNSKPPVPSPTQSPPMHVPGKPQVQPGHQQATSSFNIGINPNGSISIGLNPQQMAGSQPSQGNSRYAPVSDLPQKPPSRYMPLENDLADLARQVEDLIGVDTSQPGGQYVAI